MACPHCGSDRLNKHLYHADGRVQLICLDCGRCHTPNALTSPQGGRVKGDTPPLTSTERVRRYRARKKLLRQQNQRTN
jgi:hypothetical protein